MKFYTHESSNSFAMQPDEAAVPEGMVEVSEQEFNDFVAQADAARALAKQSAEEDHAANCAVVCAALAAATDLTEEQIASALRL